MHPIINADAEDAHNIALKDQKPHVPMKNERNGVLSSKSKQDLFVKCLEAELRDIKNTELSFITTHKDMETMMEILKI